MGQWRQILQFFIGTHSGSYWLKLKSMKNYGTVYTDLGHFFGTHLDKFSRSPS